MIGLPPMANQDGIQKYKQTKFGGYNHTLGADNGDIWDMKNMTSDFYPCSHPGARAGRYARLQNRTGSTRTTGCTG